MTRVVEELLNMLRREPLRPLLLTGYCQDAPAGILRLLPQALSACGGWLLRHTATTQGAVRAVFEIERSAAMEMYVALAGLGLLLEQASQLALTQTCQCTRYISLAERFDVVTVELLIEQNREAACIPAAA